MDRSEAANRDRLIQWRFPSDHRQRKIRVLASRGLASGSPQHLHRLEGAGATSDREPEGAHEFERLIRSCADAHMRTCARRIRPWHLSFPRPSQERPSPSPQTGDHFVNGAGGRLCCFGGDLSIRLSASSNCGCGPFFFSRSCLLGVVIYRGIRAKRLAHDSLARWDSLKKVVG